jgi:hypothetical protein
MIVLIHAHRRRYFDRLACRSSSIVTRRMMCTDFSSKLISSEFARPTSSRSSLASPSMAFFSVAVMCAINPGLRAESSGETDTCHQNSFFTRSTVTTVANFCTPRVKVRANLISDWRSSGSVTGLARAKDCRSVTPRLSREISKYVVGSCHLIIQESSLFCGWVYEIMTFEMRPIGFVSSPLTETVQIPKGCGR